MTSSPRRRHIDGATSSRDYVAHCVAMIALSICALLVISGRPVSGWIVGIVGLLIAAIVLKNLSDGIGRL